MPPAVPSPNLLTDPGFLWISPIGTADPTNTVAGSVFTDVVAAAWLPLGPTMEGSAFAYSTSVEPIRVAELTDPVKFVTTERSGTIAFALASWTLSNYRRALNGGIAALTPTSGTGATALYTVTPPVPGAEVRAMILWESTDATIRLRLKQTIQGGEINTEFRRGTANSSIPCTFNMEIPAGATAPFDIWGAGVSRG